MFKYCFIDQIDWISVCLHDFDFIDFIDNVSLPWISFFVDMTLYDTMENFWYFFLWQKGSAWQLKEVQKEGQSSQTWPVYKTCGPKSVPSSVSCQLQPPSWRLAALIWFNNHSASDTWHGMATGQYMRTLRNLVRQHYFSLLVLEISAGPTQTGSRDSWICWW